MMKIFRLIIAIAFTLILFFARAQQNKISHVILVGFDGFGAYSVPVAKMMTMKMEEGANGLSCGPVLLSGRAANCASMLVALTPELHG